jgi:putative transposase
MTLTWVRRGERKRVPYENPQRRRLNVLAATVQWTDHRELHWLPVRRHFTAVDVVCCLEQLAVPGQRTVVVLDNASFHRDRLVRAALPPLRAQGVYLYYLPAYSPELNDIERLFRTIKHSELPERTYATFDALEVAVRAAFTRVEERHYRKPLHQPGRAA